MNEKKSSNKSNHDNVLENSGCVETRAIDLVIYKHASNRIVTVVVVLLFVVIDTSTSANGIHRCVHVLASRGRRVIHSE